MSTRASGKLQPELSRSGEQAPHLTALCSPKKSLRDVVQENEIYSDVVDEINKKLALREAIERANMAIANGKASRAGDEASKAGSIFSQARISARPSQADAVS